MTEVVYDKAKYHYEADNFPPDLQEFQGYVHTGFSLKWLITNGLVSDEFKQDWAKEIEECRLGKITGPKLFQKMDGVLSSFDLNDVGNKFASEYFDFDRGFYLADYSNVFKDVDNPYYVKDTLDNYKKIEARISFRFNGGNGVSHH